MFRKCDIVQSMKKGHIKSSYWHTNAMQFTDFYGNPPWWSLRFPVHRFLLDRTKKLIAYTPSSRQKTMLDMGCGSGEHMQYFIPKHKHVYGIDYSRQMIREAKQTLRQFPKKKYTLCVSDAHHIPLPDQSIHTVIAMGLLDYVDSPQKVIKECRRVLKPHGILVASMPKKPSVFSFLRTPFGVIFRNHMFHLPPVRNAINKTGCHALFSDNGFVITNSSSIWGAMWMVQARKL